MPAPACHLVDANTPEGTNKAFLARGDRATIPFGGTGGLNGDRENQFILPRTLMEDTA